MKRTSVVVLFVAVLACLGVVVAQVVDRATGRGSEDRVVAPRAVGLDQTAHEVEPGDIDEIIASRAGGVPVITRTRIFEFGRIQEFEGVERAMDREQATFDATSESLVVTGKFRGLDTIEDIRLIESNDIIYVVRDVYPHPDDATLFSGRNTPIALESTSGDTDPAAGPKNALNRTAALAVATPQVTSLGGVTMNASGIVNGRAAMDCGKAYNGVMVANDRDADNIAWYITGSNFGSTAGTVILAGRTARIVQWTSTWISVVPTLPWNYAPLSTLLTVRTASGTSTSYGVGVAPAIRTRVFSQCTWYCARKRLELGKSPSPTAYASNGTINASYTPQVGDQFQWQGRHVAIVIGVSGPAYATGGYKTWTLTIGEYNASCNNAYKSYTTTFQTRTTSTGTTVTRYPLSSVTSFGNASLYYR